MRQMLPEGGAGVPDAMVPVEFSPYYQPVVDAIRAALDEAAKVAQGYANDPDAEDCGRLLDQFTAAVVAAEIRALRAAP